ncbi:sensor histidine kinase [Butyrivibrio sp. VCD2006]|uniref:sensor histidine kinase n=1 Tax=Butyrivibrio sp. VCD2006 TaxID=1280664 RepID=UPI0003F8FD2E|nr:HAMP domain-containing sensor histidine kinase [Butyrivibrio sp. VCD2006]
MISKRKFEQPDVNSDTIAQLSRQLIEANTKLKRTENERTAMLENISHDLRAPLTAIRSTIDYIKLKRDDPECGSTGEEMNSLVKLLDARTKTLEVMIQDLYYMTCIDSGREEFNLEDIPLAQFLEEYFFALEIDDKYKDYDFVLDVPDDLDVVVHIDISKFERVLDNLFTNARKYSDKGSKITLGAGQNSDGAFFYVEDTGYGIPKESIPYIFDRTYKVSNARTPKDDSSSGLGLAITKRIVEFHGGKITCESTLGKGSRFTVFL